MSLDESFLERLRRLPPEKLREAVDFVEFLHQKTAAAKGPRESVKGLWAGLGLDITEQDIEVARAENWDGFPRKDI